MHSSQTQSFDLLVVGAGQLGKEVAKEWKTRIGSHCRITGETRTKRLHDALISIGVEPRLRHDPSSNRFPFVLFSVPPSGSENYEGDVERALSLWDGTGNFVFTSSGSVYAQNNEETVTEFSQVASVQPDDVSSRATLIRSERIVLEKGGNVVRLAGLYSIDRGPHVYWFQQGVVRGNPKGLINLIHYSDAAKLIVSVLCRHELHSQIFLGCDGNPLTRERICKTAKRLDSLKSLPLPIFERNDRAGGRRYDNSWTRNMLQWGCIFSSFENFVASLES
eukprot:jgi/Galph1/2454/GphlegSOOS_G1093.1